MDTITILMAMEMLTPRAGAGIITLTTGSRIFAKVHMGRRTGSEGEWTRPETGGIGHTFVFGGDYPAVDTSRVGLLGADLTAENGRWRIRRIYTAEAWNPGLVAPLDRPGAKVEEWHYLVGVDGVELTSAHDPFRLLDGTEGRKTVLHLNDKPSMEGAWKEIITPVRSEGALRQRAWVEDNRRRVDELTGGRVAHVWVPNTGDSGVVSFDRYYFAQQDKQGAVIDERFNGGGLLDDYMVDLMTRRRGPRSRMKPRTVCRSVFPPGSSGRKSC